MPQATSYLSCAARQEFLVLYHGSSSNIALKLVALLMFRLFICSFGLSAVRQSSNIFFTNGNYDPFIACGPTVNISATIIAAVYGTHIHTLT